MEKNSTKFQKALMTVTANSVKKSHFLKGGIDEEFS